MNKNYPRLINTGEVLPDQVGKHECDCCKAGATHTVRVAHSYMRGEDDFHAVCPRHWSMARNNLDKFYGHYRSKDKFFAKEEGSNCPK